MEIIQSPFGEKVRDLFGLAVVLSPKIVLKKKTITKDLLQQSYKVHPHGYSPAAWFDSQPDSSRQSKAVQLSKLLELWVDTGPAYVSMPLLKN